MFSPSRCVIILFNMNQTAKIITIPKSIAHNEDLVVLPRSMYENFLKKVASEKTVTEKDVLRWSKEAKRLKKVGKLPILRSLKDLR